VGRPLSSIWTAAGLVAAAGLLIPGTSLAQAPDDVLERLPAEARASWFGLPQDRDGGGLQRQLLPRVHDEVEVVGRGILVFRRDGVIVRILGRVEALGPIPARTASEEDAAAVAVHHHPGSEITRTTPLITRIDGAWRPIVAVDLRLPYGLPARLHITTDGPPEVVREIELFTDDSHGTGTVQVFDTSVMHGDLVIRPVDELEYEHWLSSVDRMVFDPAFTDPNPLQYSEADQWHWTPDQLEFSIAMGFYHLQAHERFVAAVLAPDWWGEMGEPERGVVNVGDDTFDDPSLQFRAGHAFIQDDFGNRVHLYLFGAGGSLGPGVAVANFAHDGEVWAHEQGHAITSELTPFDDIEISAQSEEFAALHEGLSDYTAAAYTDDPRLLESLVTWSDELLRPADVVRTWPDDFDDGGDPHENGRIISSMGWAFRQIVGPEAADRIVHASPYYLAPSAAGFRALAEGMVLADEDGHDGRYVVPLIETLRAHGTWPETTGSDPVAVGSWTGRAPLGEEVTVEAEAEGTLLAGAAWSLVEAPPDSTLVIEGEDRWGTALTFTPDVCGPYVFELRVASPGRQLSEPVLVEVIPCGTGCSCSTARPTRTGSAALLLLVLAGWRRSRSDGSEPPDQSSKRMPTEPS
jgi:hypothetical protein